MDMARSVVLVHPDQAKDEQSIPVPSNNEARMPVILDSAAEGRIGQVLQRGHQGPRRGAGGADEHMLAGANQLGSAGGRGDFVVVGRKRRMKRRF